MRIVALITVALLLAGCAALKSPPGNQDDAALYLPNRCLGGVGEALRGPYSCFEADNRGLAFSGAGPGFAPAVGGVR